MRKILFILLLPFLIVGCGGLFGEEIGRIELAEPLVEGESTFYVEKGAELAFWVEIDITYDGDLDLIFDVEVLREGTLMGAYQLDALKVNPTVNEQKYTMGGHTSWSFSGEMSYMPIGVSGDYTVKALFRNSDNPTLQIEKIDLVMKI